MSQSQSQARRDFPEIVVFTGDLVGSSKLTSDDLTRAMAALGDRLSGRVRHLAGRRLAGGLLRLPRRQLAMPRPGSRLHPARRPPPARPALHARTAFDTRISIGIRIRLAVAARHRRRGLRPAFELSRATGSAGWDRTGDWPSPGNAPARPLPSGAIFALADEISRTGHRATRQGLRAVRRDPAEPRSWPRRSGSPSRHRRSRILRAAATGRLQGRRCAHWRVSDDDNTESGCIWKYRRNRL